MGYKVATTLGFGLVLSVTCIIIIIIVGSSIIISQAQ
jgi:hypothetical protein